MLSMGSALLLLLELESMHYWQLEAQSPLPTWCQRLICSLQVQIKLYCFEVLERAGFCSITTDQMGLLELSHSSRPSEHHSASLHHQASSRGASFSLPPVCPDNQTKRFSESPVVNQPRNWGWDECFFCPQLRFSQAQCTYLDLDVIQQLFLAEPWRLVIQEMALEVSSGLKAAILCRENKGRWTETKKKY